MGFRISVVWTFIAIFLLTTGSDLLLIDIGYGSNFPLGTLVTWAGMISLPFAILLGVPGIYSPSDPTFPHSQ